MITRSSHETPKYEINKSNSFISVYINSDNDLIIIGHADNNYVYWVSLTKADDKARNETIFNYIAYNPSARAAVAHLSDAVHIERYEWYHARLFRPEYDKNRWSTTFGHYYGDEEPAGQFFAGDVAVLLQVLLRKCSFREAGGAYENVLDYALSEMDAVKDTPYGYNQMLKLIEIMDKEDYLALSPNKRIREKYVRFLETKSRLYGQYMDVAR